MKKKMSPWCIKIEVRMENAKMIFLKILAGEQQDKKDEMIDDSKEQMKYNKKIPVRKESVIDGCNRLECQENKIISFNEFITRTNNSERYDDSNQYDLRLTDQSKIEIPHNPQKISSIKITIAHKTNLQYLAIEYFDVPSMVNIDFTNPLSVFRLIVLYYLSRIIQFTHHTNTKHIDKTRSDSQRCFGGCCK